MSSPLAAELRRGLERSPVSCKPERRGYETRRGVPDCVVWVHPEDFTISRCFPILYELEGIGGYHQGKEDAEKFADRYGDDTHQYHLRWPTLGNTGIDSTTAEIHYELRSAPSAAVTGEFSTSEERFYKVIKKWANGEKKGFRTSAHIKQYADTEVVWWTVEFTAFSGHKFKVKTPFIVQSGSNLDRVINTRFGRIELPMLVVVDGLPSSHRHSLPLETAIEFPVLAPASIPA